MKTYYVEEWVEEDEKRRDGWASDPWKFGKYPVVYEFENEKDLNEKIYSIINNGGVISKVWIQE